MFLDHAIHDNEKHALMPDSILTILLSSNKKLLQNQITPEVVTDLIKLCMDDINERFLILLRSMCSCKGEPVVAKQNLICSLLLDNDDFRCRLVYEMRLFDTSIQDNWPPFIAGMKLVNIKKIKALIDKCETMKIKNPYTNETIRKEVKKTYELTDQQYVEFIDW